MSLLRSLLDWKWKRTKDWFTWEKEVLHSVASQIPDAGFRKAFRSQVDKLYEIYRDREGSGYYAWPAFLGSVKSFTHSELHTLATLTAQVQNQRISITVRVLAGGIYRINIVGENLPTPNRIQLQDLAVTVVDLPVPRKMPVLNGWVKRLCHSGIIAPGDMPLGPEELERHRQRFPGLPADYLEFCSQTEGGTLLPKGSEYAIFGLGDIGIAHTPRGQAFIPLVDMRELGGLGCLVADKPQPILTFSSHPEGTFFAETFQAAIKRVAKEEMT